MKNFRMSRRDFLKSAAVALVGVVLSTMKFLWNHPSFLKEARHYRRTDKLAG